MAIDQPTKPALEYDIFVPLVEASGHRYAQALTQDMKTEIADFFGGITDTHHAQEGWWKVGGMMVRDELVIWRVLSDKGQEGDKRIRKIKARLEKVLKQEEILVVRRQVEILVESAESPYRS